MMHRLRPLILDGRHMCPTLPLFNPSRDVQAWLARLDLDYYRVMDKEWDSRVTIQGKSIDEWCLEVLGMRLHPNQLPSPAASDLVDWMCNPEHAIREYGVLATQRVAARAPVRRAPRIVPRRCVR